MLKSLTLLRPGTHSIVGRLTGWYIGSAFILIFLSTSFLYWSLSKALSEEGQSILKGRVQVIDSLLKRKVDPMESIHRRIEIEWSSQTHQPIFVQIVNHRNETVVQSPSIPDEVLKEIFPYGPTYAPNALENRPGIKINTSSGHSYLTFTEALAEESNPWGVRKIHLALDLSNEQKILGHYQTKLFLVLGLALFLCTLMGAKISETCFRPVKDIISIASNIRSTTLHERISQKRLPLELKALADTMNAMLDRLEGSFQRLSRFSTDISHELRTPINNLRGEIEVTLAKPRPVEEYQDVLQSSLEESIRISRIIDSLLFLAKAENPITQIQKESVDLNQEIRNIVEFYEPTATEEGIAIQTLIQGDIRIHVERTLFQRAIGNIVANAINYTPRGGTISISEREANDQIQVIITDTGKGIDEKDLPLIFDRFYRVDPSRTTTKLGGFGLGLTIVKSILKLHGGDISIQSKLNAGTEVRLSFPKEP